MSKSKGNVISPRDLRRALRRRHRALLHPLHRPARGGRGLVRRGRRRACTASCRGSGAAAADERPATGADGAPSRRAAPLLRKAHWAIDKVTRDIERFHFNTAIAAVMELVNEIYRQRELRRPRRAALRDRDGASLLFPFAPHLGAEVYELMTGRRVWEEPWPEADRRCSSRDKIELVVQVNGKLVDRLAGARRRVARRSSRSSRATPRSWPPG